MSAALAIERHATAEHFLAAAHDWLLVAETDNNLLLGIALYCRSHEPVRAYWATVRDESAIVGCACRTPPQRLVLTRMPAIGAALLARDAAAFYDSLSGVNGPIAAARAFADAWTAARGGRWSTQLALRLHELTRVSCYREWAPGHLRRAASEDVGRVREWVAAYVHDTGMEPPDGDFAQRLVERGQLFLWIDGGEPRAMVAATRNTGNVCAINTVYTPPEYRRRGYATAAVASLSESLLENGRVCCCLYTDATNPTSNSIYAKIGYRPIRDDIEISFVP